MGDFDNIILEAIDAGSEKIDLFLSFDELLYNISEHFYGHVRLLLQLEQRIQLPPSHNLRRNLQRHIIPSPHGHRVLVQTRHLPHLLLPLIGDLLRITQTLLIHLRLRLLRCQRA